MIEGTERPTDRPHTTRGQHQAALSRARRRQRRRRLARVRRIRFWKSARSVGFWGRTTIGLGILLAIGFWAKYAVVYDIPNYAQRGKVAHIEMYVTLKPWWFGPPVFDLQSYGPAEDAIPDDNTAYSILIAKLGKYSDVLLNPTFVWQTAKP